MREQFYNYLLRLLNSDYMYQTNKLDTRVILTDSLQHYKINYVGEDTWNYNNRLKVDFILNIIIGLFSVG